MRDLLQLWLQLAHGNLDVVGRLRSQPVTGRKSEESAQAQICICGDRSLVDTPVGTRQFRTVVDSLGMGDAVTAFNDAADQMTSAVYGAFGMPGMLEVKAETI